MIVTPYSRRLRLVSGMTVMAVVVTYLQLRPRWKEASLGYARGYYASVSNYLGGDQTYNNTLYQAGNEEKVSQYHNFTDPCADFPDTEGIVLVMKTGATEAFDRVPTHLLTTMQCLPDFLIFSDMEQQIGRYHVYDVLANVEETAKAHNNDFDLYRVQKECPVTQKSCVDARAGRDRAWHLDKYKFLPMMERTWEMRPGRDWYVFVEADTYVFWPNLVEWLREQSGINPKEKIYMGSRSFIRNIPFGHGGSGYVMSGTLLKHLIEYHPGVVNQFNNRGSQECCGDLMLALALRDYEDVQIWQAWPMFNGEKPNTLPFGPGHWCEPIITMHHMQSEEVSSVWQFEQTRKTDRTLLIKDLYEGLIAPKMVVERDDWDNLSDDVCYINPDPTVQERALPMLRARQKSFDDMNDVEKEAWRSPEHCSKVCKSQDVPDEDEWDMMHKLVQRDDTNPAESNNTQKAEDTDPSDEFARVIWRKQMRERKKNRSCFQYRWQDEQCCTSRSFKLGAPKAPPADGNPRFKWKSGWDLKGINDWIEATGECSEVKWTQPEVPADDE